jgi:hypothetical protein
MVSCAEIMLKRQRLCSLTVVTVDRAREIGGVASPWTALRQNTDHALLTLGRQLADVAHRSSHYIRLNLRRSRQALCACLNKRLWRRTGATRVLRLGRWQDDFEPAAPAEPGQPGLSFPAEPRLRLARWREDLAREVLLPLANGHRRADCAAQPARDIVEIHIPYLDSAVA